MTLELTGPDELFLSSLPICQPNRSGAQYVLVPAHYLPFFEPLRTVRIDQDCEHGTTIDPIDPRAHFLEVARRHLGKPFGCMARPMDAPTQFSCSTFTTYVAGHCGIFLPRYAIRQSYRGRSVDPQDARPGDLLFYDGAYAPTDADRRIGHVAIKSGKDTIIHGSSLRGAIVEHHYQERKVRRASDLFPTGPQLLVTLPRMIPDMDSAACLVRYWQRKELGR